jgi:type I restriction enzyme M protein
MARHSSVKDKRSGGANLGFEATLWAAADKLRGHMDAAEYKHVVLGLIFLKYISDAFEEQHAKLAAEKGADPEDRDEYRAVNIFWVPPEARWTYLQGRAKDPLVGKLLDNAMVAIERDNTSLKGVLPKNYARPDLNKQQLGEVIDLIAKIGLGDKESRSKDNLGGQRENRNTSRTAFCGSPRDYVPRTAPTTYRGGDYEVGICIESTGQALACSVSPRRNNRET